MDYIRRENPVVSHVLIEIRLTSLLTSSANRSFYDLPGIELLGHRASICHIIRSALQIAS